ncbi:LysR family transcriptional regulator [Pseudonocardia xinjiangensis]|uniref:LysR family transcriptional regulator n=1 Tax=Pseudonocardia xinjiangensis TaxID=75289 RepID=UPI003D8E8605
MELRHLQYFVTVAEERNFTRAAARLHVVQSGVSAAIKALERELGAELLHRTSKRVALTDAGAALLPGARATLDAARDARDALDQVRGGLRGTLRVGTMSSLGTLDLPGLLGRYHRRHPEVVLQISVAPSGSQGLVEALADGRLDLAFVSMSGRAPGGVDWCELASTPLDLVVPVGHRLAEEDEVRIEMFADEPFVDFPIGYGNRSVTDRAFAAAGLHRHVAIEITDIVAAADFVRECIGVALLPGVAVRPGDDLRQVRIVGADLDWPLSVAAPTARATGAAARALLSLLSEQFSGRIPVGWPHVPPSSGGRRTSGP